MIFLIKPCGVVNEAAFATATAFVTFVFSAPDVVVVVVVVVAVAGVVCLFVCLFVLFVCFVCLFVCLFVVNFREKLKDVWDRGNSHALPLPAFCCQVVHVYNKPWL